MKDIFDDLPLFSDNQIPYSNKKGGSDDTYLSMAEYEELRLLLTTAKAAFADENKDILPDPSIRKNLKAMIASRKKRFTFPELDIKAALFRPIPAYQFGFAMVTIVVLAFFAGRNNSFNLPGNSKVGYKSDTAYKVSHKSAAPVMYLSDSQYKVTRPSSTLGNYYADSIDISSDNGIEDNIQPSGNNQSPVHLGKQDHYHEMQKPKDIDDTEKGSNSIEDSSKWNRHLHGLM